MGRFRLLEAEICASAVDSFMYNFYPYAPILDSAENVTVTAICSYGLEITQALKNPTPIFNPSEFLAKVGGGRTIAKYRKNQKVFAQGDVADAVY
jgi:hypothetical protein